MAEILKQNLLSATLLKKATILEVYNNQSVIDTSKKTVELVVKTRPVSLLLVKGCS